MRQDTASRRIASDCAVPVFLRCRECLPIRRFAEALPHRKVEFDVDFNSALFVTSAGGDRQVNRAHLFAPRDGSWSLSEQQSLSGLFLEVSRSLHVDVANAKIGSRRVSQLTQNAWRALFGAMARACFPVPSNGGERKKAVQTFGNDVIKSKNSVNQITVHPACGELQSSETTAGTVPGRNCRALQRSSSLCRPAGKNICAIARPVLRFAYRHSGEAP